MTTDMTLEQTGWKRIDGMKMRWLEPESGARSVLEINGCREALQLRIGSLDSDVADDNTQAIEDALNSGEWCVLPKPALQVLYSLIGSALRAFAGLTPEHDSCQDEHPGQTHDEWNASFDA